MTVQTSALCLCGHPRDPEFDRYIGPQECGDGEVALLHNCSGCKTTYSGAVLTDAAVCADCKHAIVGDAEDPKVIATIDTSDGVESRIWCLDCAQAYVNRFAARCAA